MTELEVVVNSASDEKLVDIKTEKDSIDGKSSSREGDKKTDHLQKAGQWYILND